MFVSHLELDVCCDCCDNYVTVDYDDNEVKADTRDDEFWVVPKDEAAFLKKHCPDWQYSNEHNVLCPACKV